MESEEEKAKVGELYDANDDAERLSEKAACKENCYELNHQSPSQTKKRDNPLRNLLGKVGNDIIIEPPFYGDYDYNVEIGDDSFSNMNCVIEEGSVVKKGIPARSLTTGNPCRIIRRI